MTCAGPESNPAIVDILTYSSDTENTGPMRQDDKHEAV